jgi:hypothetical protein
MKWHLADGTAAPEWEGAARLTSAMTIVTEASRSSLDGTERRSIVEEVS